ncbi:hypothetical protein [Tateyamaria sp. Alg231-49]|uniref:hypothetical protein n=1 Tax=Tateyamaria sp. Alg231-49 TaxID=1922219 RepID=UPI000D5500A7|nr:hypothetical protein [Tateyamaria sp. Alg231-49]
MTDDKLCQVLEHLLSGTQVSVAENVVDAAKEHLQRKHRISHPEGDFDSGGRFYLAVEERRGCCEWIREPSRAHPYSEMLHGRSLRHVAELFEADELEVRRLAKRIESEFKATS